ncbi:hypothetical protein [Bartonella sp. ML70XJBT.G]|uniref:hypothetical protein n=1 Tax=Bartonella sp. ML70XJBT.G TaxID=3019093 RepID=UPI002360BD19|nr:hypothetical protein [Bartonella sp. ML70XJBT.G]
MPPCVGWFTRTHRAVVFLGLLLGFAADMDSVDVGVSLKYVYAWGGKRARSKEMPQGRWFVKKKVGKKESGGGCQHDNQSTTKQSTTK